MLPTKVIKVAKSAKMIENAQRDINIHLQGITQLCRNKLGIDPTLFLERLEQNGICFKI